MLVTWQHGISWKPTLNKWLKLAPLMMLVQRIKAALVPLRTARRPGDQNRCIVAGDGHVLGKDLNSK